MRYEAHSLKRNLTFQAPSFIGTLMTVHATFLAATGWASDLDWLISGVLVFVVMVAVFVIATPRRPRQNRRCSWEKPRRGVRKTHV